MLRHPQALSVRQLLYKRPYSLFFPKLGMSQYQWTAYYSQTISNNTQTAQVQPPTPQLDPNQLKLFQQLTRTVNPEITTPHFRPHQRLPHFLRRSPLAHLTHLHIGMAHKTHWINRGILVKSVVITRLPPLRRTIITLSEADLEVASGPVAAGGTVIAIAKTTVTGFTTELAALALPMGEGVGRGAHLEVDTEAAGEM
ncbi:hypothetical protein B0F90DRAFT_934963 [Multifurca ochricompacta]|uniref:Uncharacterized protein n=1 Tax=Multifurca ochricompacta TaxID=376703 RepID=A0AAD4M9Q2_9AGAM|nr:hypothetical protein B0F90DRAFT_934963 [Multifurca ochricompacta]